MDFDRGVIQFLYPQQLWSPTGGFRIEIIEPKGRKKEKIEHKYKRQEVKK